VVFELHGSRLNAKFMSRCLELTTCLYLTPDLDLEHEGWMNDITWHCWMKSFFCAFYFLLLPI
jgi:hypothetical protein